MFQSCSGTPRPQGTVMVVKPFATSRSAFRLLPSQVMTTMSLEVSFAPPSQMIVRLPCFFTISSICKTWWRKRARIIAFLHAVGLHESGDFRRLADGAPVGLITADVNVRRGLKNVASLADDGVERLSYIFGLTMFISAPIRAACRWRGRSSRRFPAWPDERRRNGRGFRFRG